MNQAMGRARRIGQPFRFGHAQAFGEQVSKRMNSDVMIRNDAMNPAVFADASLIQTLKKLLKWGSGRLRPRYRPGWRRRFARLAPR